MFSIVWGKKLEWVVIPIDIQKQFACSFEFRRNYVPLWVLFRKLGMKGVFFLRKRWCKFYRRCIVKFNFLAFIERIKNFLLSLFMSKYLKYHS